MSSAAAGWFTALSAGDITALSTLLAPEAELIGPDGRRVRGSDRVLRWLMDAASPADARLRVGTVTHAYGIAAATLSVEILLADGEHMTERGVMAVTVGRRGVRRVVIDDETVYISDT